MQEQYLSEQEAIEAKRNDALAVTYLNKVYMWMATALLATAGVAMYTLQSQSTMDWITSGSNFIIVMVASIALFLVMLFGGRFFSASALGVLFLGYSALTGLVFGPILSMYTSASIGLTFAVTAGTFAAMSLFGAFTKRNLSGMGRFLIMALIGLIIANIANIFMGNGMLDLICSCAGVLIFSGLTAYDTQRLLEQGRVLPQDQMGKPAVMGALTLYLDFINLFLYLLRFLGRTND